MEWGSRIIFAQQHFSGPKCRDGSKATMSVPRHDVRYSPNSDHLLRGRFHLPLSAGCGSGRGVASPLLPDRRRGHCHRRRWFGRVRADPTPAVRRSGGAVRVRPVRTRRPGFAPTANRGAEANLGHARARTASGHRLSEHFVGDGEIVFEHACKLGCEGIVLKRLGSHYRSGRSTAWLKIKNPAAPAVRREAEEDWR